MKHKFVAAVVLSLSLSAIPALAESTILSSTSDTKIDTHFYGIQARTFDLGFSAPWVTSYKDSRVIVLGPDQNFPDNNPINGGLESKYPLALFDSATFTATPLGSIDLTSVVGLGSRMRVLDFQYFSTLQSSNISIAKLLLSIVSVDAAKQCRRLTVQEILIDPTGAQDNRLGKTIYKLPCVPSLWPDQNGNLPAQALNQSGGRLATLMNNRTKKPMIYLSTGDFQVLATHGEIFSKSVTSFLGAILELGPSGTAKVVAKGFRNPQGLTASLAEGKQVLFATSHGPRGGDELALIRQGDDFGWPYESFGTAYGSGGPPR